MSGTYIRQFLIYAILCEPLESKPGGLSRCESTCPPIKLCSLTVYIVHARLDMWKVCKLVNELALSE